MNGTSFPAEKCRRGLRCEPRCVADIHKVRGEYPASNEVKWKQILWVVQSLYPRAKPTRPQWSTGQTHSLLLLLALRSVLDIICHKSQP
ncbi:hypothetical protein ScPMuIL_005267 [Solemya velum]